MEDEKKNTGIDPELVCLLQDTVTTGVNEGVKRAVEGIEMQRALADKIRYDNRIRNTKLLLSNYRKFKNHIKTATYTEEQLDTAETSEILDKLGMNLSDEYDKTVVESILKSKKRTEIILQHIETILDGYILQANKRDDIELKRRANVVDKLFRKGKKMDQIAREEHTSISTIKRDRNKATNEIAVLMFRNRSV